MKAFANIQLLEIADTLVSLTTTFIMGSIIGFERQYRQPAPHTQRLAKTYLAGVALMDQSLLQEVKETPFLSIRRQVLGNCVSALQA